MLAARCLNCKDARFLALLLAFFDCFHSVSDGHFGTLGGAIKLTGRFSQRQKLPRHSNLQLLKIGLAR